MDSVMDSGEELGWAATDKSEGLRWVTGPGPESVLGSGARRGLRLGLGLGVGHAGELLSGVRRVGLGAVVRSSPRSGAVDFAQSASTKHEGAAVT